MYVAIMTAIFNTYALSNDMKSDISDFYFEV